MRTVSAHINNVNPAQSVAFSEKDYNLANVPRLMRFLMCAADSNSFNAIDTY